MLEQVDIPHLKISLIKQDVLRMNLVNQKHQLITGSYFLGFIHDDQRAVEVLNQLHDHLQIEGSMIIKESVTEDKDASVCEYGYLPRSTLNIDILLALSKFSRTTLIRNIHLKTEKFDNEHYWVLEKKSL